MRLMRHLRRSFVRRPLRARAACTGTSLETSDPRRLRQVAARPGDQVRQVLALEPCDELVLRLVEGLIRLERLPRRAHLSGAARTALTGIIVGARERDRARDHVAELADVAGPVIALQPRERLAADLPASCGAPASRGTSSPGARGRRRAGAAAARGSRRPRAGSRGLRGTLRARPRRTRRGGSPRPRARRTLALAPAERHDLACLEHAEELRLYCRRGRSPTSSRNSVPPWAARTRRRIACRPGERALTWPNRSLSISVSVDAPQSNTTNGPRAAATHRGCRAPSAPCRTRSRRAAGPACWLRRALEDRERLPHRDRAAVQRAEPVGGFDGGMSTTSSAGMSWISVLPMRSATPGGATTFWTATPSMTVPFLLPRSVITEPLGLGATEQCRRETNVSVSATSHARSVPITTPICGRSISRPRSGPSTTRRVAVPTCPRAVVAFVTRVTSIAPL